jgi:hypothetical protein
MLADDLQAKGAMGWYGYMLFLECAGARGVHDTEPYGNPFGAMALQRSEFKSIPPWLSSSNDAKAAIESRPIQSRDETATLILG